MSIEVISISNNLGSNLSTVAFKLFDTSTPLHRLVNEYRTEIEGRFDDFSDPELIAKLEEKLRTPE